MEAINLSQTSLKILSVFFANPGRKFYTNELIRETGLYPNSVQVALKTLEKQKVLLGAFYGRLRLYQINPKYDFIDELRGIIGKSSRSFKSEDLEKIPLERKWKKIMSRRGSVPFVSEWLGGLKRGMKQYVEQNQVFAWYNSVTGGVYYNWGELERSGLILKEKFERDSLFATTILKKFRNACKNLLDSAKGMKSLNLPNLTKSQLFQNLIRYQNCLADLIPFLAIPLAIENLLEDEIKEELDKVLNKRGQSERRDKYFEILVAPSRQDFDQQKEALRVAADFKKYGMNGQVKEEIVKYASRYCWLPLEAYIGEPLPDSYFEDEIKYLAKKNKSPLTEIKRIEGFEIKRQRQIKETLKKLRINPLFGKKVRLLQEYIYLRTFRIKIQSKANYYHTPLLYEIASRMELDKKEIIYLSYAEILSWLKHDYGRKSGYSYESLKKEIAKRMSGWAILMWKGKIRIITGVEKIIEAMERCRIVAPTPAMGRVVKGNPACRGRVTGRVKIVRKLSELSKVEEGDVLVAKMTTPDYMLAIHKAVAIVTDEGGVTCHAAIVSREFNLPCIVGTRNGTQVLSDGDIVEVDADNGVVRMVEDVEVDENIKIIPGKTAYKGKVRGPVRIILDAGDFPKVQEGDILVAPQTTPEYLSSLYKVKGFVVDEDSITSHAMLYAKALRLPSLIATNFARNVLQDGEMVELDATNGVLKRLK